MKTSAASFLLGFIVAVWLTPLARRLALRFQMVDRPQDGRRINQKSIPRGGGLAIAAGVLVPILCLGFYENAISHAMYDDMAAVVVLLVGALAALGVGLTDDLIRPSAKLRLLALTAIAALTWVGGHRINEAFIPGLGQVTMGLWSLPVTVLWIVGVIVAFNFVDGLDGLATGIALISTMTLFVYAQVDNNVLWMTWTGAMAGALLGFLIFNFNPASIFMGDAGSNFLGYLLAVVALQTSRKEATAVSLAVPLCILGLPLLDATLTMIRRKLLRQGLFTSEQGHLHHRLVQLGLSHRRAVLVLYGVAAVLCFGAVSITVPDLHLNIAALITAVMFGLMFATGYIRPRDLMKMYLQGKANELRQHHVETVCQEIAQRLEAARRTAVDVTQSLEQLVESGFVTAVLYKCEHSCEFVAGAYSRSAKGTRHMVRSGHAGAATAIVFWQGRTEDPSPREVAALHKLFAGIECSCAAPAALVRQDSSGRDAGRILRRRAVTHQLEKVWSALVEAAERLSLQRIQFEVYLPWVPERFDVTWEEPAPKETERSWRLDVPVMWHSRAVGCLRVIAKSRRDDIAGLLDVLESSESYLQSIFAEQGQVPVSFAGAHVDLARGRSAPAETELCETEIAHS